MKSILIVNLHSAQNAGDHALLQMSLADLHHHFPQRPITLSANDPVSYHVLGQRENVVPSFYYWIQVIPSRGLTRFIAIFWLLLLSILAAILYRLTGRAILWPIPTVQRQSIKAYFDADVVVSCPGNFLYSRSYQAGFPLLLTVYSIAYAWLAGKPIFMLPQTIGPIHRRWERLLLAWLLRRVQRVLVRDSLSLDLLYELGVPPANVRLLADMAFQPPSRDVATGTELLLRYGITPDKQRPLLGVTAINWGAQDPSFKGQESYEAILAATIERFVREMQGSVVIFSQVCGPKAADDDRVPARRIKQHQAIAKVASRVVVVDDILPPSVLRAAYAQMDIFIGSRLHSNIFALSEGVPVLAIAYQMKTWGVMQMLGLQEWVVDIASVDEDNLDDLCSQLWSVRQRLRTEIPDRINQIIDERQNTLDTVYLEMASVFGMEER